MKTKLINPVHKSAKIFTYDLEQAREIVKLVDAAIVNNTDPIALGIANVIAHKMDDCKLLIEIKDYIRANYTAMARMLGCSLTQRIKLF